MAQRWYVVHVYSGFEKKVAESIREGLMTPEEAKQHRMRDVITRALGFERTVQVDVQVRAVRRGDVFLLCSDGLSGKVSDAEMADLVVAALVVVDARAIVVVGVVTEPDTSVLALVPVGAVFDGLIIDDRHRHVLVDEGHLVGDEADRQRRDRAEEQPKERVDREDRAADVGRTDLTDERRQDWAGRNETRGPEHEERELQAHRCR